MIALALLDIIDPPARGAGDDLIVLAFAAVALLAVAAWLRSPMPERSGGYRPRVGKGPRLPVPGPSPALGRREART